MLHSVLECSAILVIYDVWLNVVGSWRYSGKPGQFLSFSTTQRSSKEAKIMGNPDYFHYSAVRQSDRDELNFNGSQATRFTDAIIQLILVRPAAK